MEIIRARADQAEPLSEIAWKAKAAWGYPAHWLEKWRSVLRIRPEQIAANPYFIAQATDGQCVGFYGLHPSESVWQLEHLWVQPERWKRGVGRQLFQHAVAHARAHGAGAVAIESDPNAEGFYLRMGARRIGSLETGVDGQRRVVPQFLYTLDE